MHFHFHFNFISLCRPAANAVSPPIMLRDDIPSSLTTCNHFLLFAVCDNAFNTAAAQASSTDCNMLCDGSPTEFCGGPNRLNAYNYTGTGLPTNPGGGGGGGGSPAAPATVFPVLDDLPTSWAYNACWV